MYKICCRWVAFIINSWISTFFHPAGAIVSIYCFEYCWTFETKLLLLLLSTGLYIFRKLYSIFYSIFFFFGVSQQQITKKETIDLNNITMYISQFLYIWAQHFLDKVFWLSSLNWPSIPKIWSRRIWTGSKMLHTKM